jgi:hypothetical protein
MAAHSPVVVRNLVSHPGAAIRLQESLIAIIAA